MSLPPVQVLFQYHQCATERQHKACVAIRTACADLAKVIVANAPSCADQATAIRKLREVMQTALAAVVVPGGGQYQWDP